MSEQMTPGERIKQARKNAKLTQEELGRLVDVTGVSIMRYEKGERSPDYMTTCRLASALKLKIEDLMSEAAKGWYEAGYEEGYDFGYEKAVTGGEQSDFIIDLDMEIRLFRSLSCLNNTGQQKAIERVEELTEIPRYRAETVPQSPPSPQEGTDIAPPLDAPEAPKKPTEDE